MSVGTWVPALLVPVVSITVVSWVRSVVGDVVVGGGMLSGSGLCCIPKRLRGHLGWVYLCSRSQWFVEKARSIGTVASEGCVYSVSRTTFLKVIIGQTLDALR